MRTPGAVCSSPGLDYRLKCQQFPHRIVGPVGVRFPVSWHMTRAPVGEGTETCYYDLETSRLLFRDLLQLSRLPAGSGVAG